MACAVEAIARFSPACAGSRAHLLGRLHRLAVQPRVCGEQPNSALSTARPAGSAPRVRGAGNRHLGGRSHGRFSPACAGSRGSPRHAGIRWSVQPRVCGEQHAARRVEMRTAGSAPRVRGADIAARTEAPRNRFSPACAGSSTTEFTISPSGLVQPRVCGEQMAACSRWRWVRGSAPRVRGAVSDARSHRGLYRFSPACAGSRSR